MKKLRNYLIVFWTSFFILVFAMGLTRHVLLNGPKNKGTPKEVVLFLSTLFGNVLNFSEISKPMILNDSFHLKNGFNYSKNYSSSRDYLLVSVWDDQISQSIVKLVQINDGKLLFQWTPDINLLNQQFNLTKTYQIKNNLTKSTTRLRHPFLMNDGSLIFNNGCIYKIDKNSKLVWLNTRPSHHSIEQDSDGNFWICGYNSFPANSEKYQIRDDAIQKISAIDGKILFEKSVFEILMENGYGKSHFFINPEVTTDNTYLDYIHLNDVQPVLTGSKYWKKGDLFLSLRHQNLVLLYRPSTNQILWSQTGPWLHQHNVDVLDSTRIGIFGNDVIDAKFPNEKDRLINGHNTEYIFDFSKNECSTPYDAFFNSADIGTYTEGRSRILSNGDIFVEETNRGRIIYGNHTEEIWSYVERINENKLSLLSWSRYITEEEFKKLTFLNQENK